MSVVMAVEAWPNRADTTLAGIPAFSEKGCVRVPEVVETDRRQASQFRELPKTL